MDLNRRVLSSGAAVLGALVLAGCGGGAGAKHAGLQVVAAENFWGSIAGALAGSKATVRSIIVNPNTDPHSYDATPADARTFAAARLAIVNGIGYGNWAPKIQRKNTRLNSSP